MYRTVRSINQVVSASLFRSCKHCASHETVAFHVDSSKSQEITIQAGAEEGTGRRRQAGNDLSRAVGGVFDATAKNQAEEKVG
jgi:hypothetical protein